MFNSIRIYGHDEIAEHLEFLTSNKNDVTHLDLNGIYMDIRIARLVAKFIASEMCVVTHLNLRNNELAHLDGSFCIADAMASNRSIIELNLSNNAVHKHPYPNSDEFVTHIADAIKHHPCIKSIDLGWNNLRYSVRHLIDGLPRSIKSLNLEYNPGISKDDVVYLLKNSKLEHLNLCNISPFDILVGIEDTIMANRTIIKLDYFWFFTIYSMEQFAVRTRLDNAIKEMLARNMNARIAAKNAALALMAIRRFRRAECGLLGYVPKELVLLMAKDIYESYANDEWHIKDQESVTKKPKNQNL
jgi:hypothetical protein